MYITHTISFSYFLSISDVNVILSEGLFSHVRVQMILFHVNTIIDTINFKRQKY